jgi:HEAT repeat protein
VIGPPAESAVPHLIAAYNRSYLKLHPLPPGQRLDWAAQFTNSSVPSVSGGSLRGAPTSFSFAAANAFWSAGLPGPLSEVELPRHELEALLAIGGAHEEIIPMALCALRDPRFFFQTGIGVRRATNNLAPAIRLSEPVILAALKDPSPIVRATAAHWLGSLAPDHGEVIPALAKALKDSDKSVRGNALRSLGEARVELEAVVTAVAGSLNDKDEGIRWQAAALLPPYGPPAREAVPALVNLLGRDPNNRLRGKAAITLGELGPKAQAAIPALREALTDEHVNVRSAATEALKAIGSTAQEK